MVADTGLYDRLGIRPDASQDQIKKAYRKRAIATHPDKNKDNPKAAEEFKEVSQAYEILSDPEKRKAYDQFGLDYILNGGRSAPPPGADAGGFEGFQSGSSFPGMGEGMPGGARSFHFTNGGPGQGFTFTNAEDIFANFFKSQNGAGEDDNLFSGFSSGGSQMPFGGPGTSRSRFREPKRAPAPEIQAVERDLQVTLEQLYHGATKKLKVSRKTFDPATGKRRNEEKPLEVIIRPGFKEGTKIKYKGWGDEQERGGGSQDLHFIIKQKPHDKFRREGDELRTAVEIDLKEALTGWNRTVATIDGKQLRVTSGTPTQPGHEIRYPEQGMVKSRKPTERGDLIIEVKVKFPLTLTAQQKQQLTQIL